MILLSELPATSCEPRQSDATKKIAPQRKSSGVRSSGTFQNLRRSAVCLNQDSDNVSLHSCRSRKQERIEPDLRTGKSA